jgi:hypothetical protein
VSIARHLAAAASMVEKRRLNLDSVTPDVPVPEFPEKQWPVTVRELMGHVGGVR